VFVGEVATIIRAPVREGIGHPGRERWVNLEPVLKRNNTGDSTHEIRKAARGNGRLLRDDGTKLMEDYEWAAI
jgi:hypothetical protein